MSDVLDLPQSDRELVTIAPKDAMQVFTTDHAIDPYLARIRKEIDAFVPVVETSTGRKEIASIAYRVAKAKTYLDGVGKQLADEVKLIPKKIDASRKHIRDTLDKWKDEVRQPLTEWEAAEEARLKVHTDALDRIAAFGLSAGGVDDFGLPFDAAILKGRLAEIEAIIVGPHCEEYEAAYARAKDQAVTRLKTAIAAREAYEAEQAELERLRKEAAERASKDREDAIRREAAEQAKREAEAAAQAERDCAAASAKAERDASERRELELKLAAESAERRAAEVEQRIKREVEEARQRELAEAAKREADKKHRAAVNRVAVEAFVVGGIAEDTARAVVTLIAKRAIPSISISY